MPEEPPKSTPRKGLPARFLIGLGAAVLVLAAAGGLVEGLCRLVPIPGLTRADLDPPYLVANAQRTEAHPYLAYALRPSWDSRPEDSADPKAYKQCHHNSLGFRGRESTWEKPEGTLRVVCIGGSSVYGHTESSDAATWPARLEHHLAEQMPQARIEVINGGCSGWSTFEMLGNLAFRMVDLEPDLVVVYESINDVRCALYPKEAPGRTRDNTHWRETWPRYRPSPLEDELERSFCYLIWRKHCTSYLKQRAELGFYAIVGYQPDRIDLYVESPPLPDLGFESFRRNLKSIVAVSRAHGAQVLLCTQAMFFAHLEGSPSKQTQTDGLLRARGVLAEVSAESGAPLCDAAAILEAEMERRMKERGRQDLFVHEVHLSDAGADLLARTIAQAIATERLLP